MESIGRPKEDAEVSSPQYGELNDYIRDDELWLEDGTIVLAACGVGSKVYKGPLLEHSPVFNNMLSLPQPAATEAGVQTCPVIPLQDHPEELRHVLRVLMLGKPIDDTSRGSPEISAESAQFFAVRTCVCICHKYQMDKLVDESLDYLCQLWPVTFGPCVKHGSVDPTHAIAVVNLARLTGAHELLPMALADCCKLSADIVQGVMLPDGTREYLSSSDLGLCFQGNNKLLEMRLEMFRRLFDIYTRNFSGCTDDFGEKDGDHRYEWMEPLLLVDEMVVQSGRQGLSCRENDVAPEVCTLGCRELVVRGEELVQRVASELLPELEVVSVED